MMGQIGGKLETPHMPITYKNHFLTNDTTIDTINHVSTVRPY